MAFRTCLNCPIEMPAKGRKFRCDPCQQAHAKALRNSPDEAAKRRARSAVSVAVVAGLLERRSCERVYEWSGRTCGRPKTYAHHEDYSRPLDVVWLCGWCHKRRHSELNKSPVPPLVFERPGQPCLDRDW
jgi:hypothetical protein